MTLSGVHIPKGFTRAHLVEPEPSWGDYGCTETSCEDDKSVDVVDSFTDIDHDGGEEKSGVCMNSVLPDDILERILGLLPFSMIMRVGRVCKKWNDMLHSQRFIQYVSSNSTQKPWYFMFTCELEPYGHVYDPLLLKWFRFGIPYLEEPTWDIVSSSGLVCFMDHVYRRKLYVCNPVTRLCRKLEEPPGAESFDYYALAISLNRSSFNYVVTIVKSKQVAGKELDWNLSINVYSSENKRWESPVNVTLQAWRGGGDSVVCRGVLYFVVNLTKMVGYPVPRHGVLCYDLASQSFDVDVDERVVSAPCPVTCMRLINLEDELVMVGGLEKRGRPGIIKGIGIWILRENEWEEVSRMPNKLFRGFGEFDDVFVCSGLGKVVYIQSYGSPALLMFDMHSKGWKWSYRCPAVKKSDLQLFSGICFEPRLDIVP